jgi:hypothetical protein
MRARDLAWPMVTALVGGVAAATSAWVVERQHRGPATKVAADIVPPEPLPAPGDLRWLVVGGGPTPENNEVGIEEDVALAARVLGAGGRVLFAGGRGAVDVRELDPGASRDGLRTELGNLFAPRAGRDSRYRASRLSIAGPATLELAESTLEAALAEGEAPFVLVLAGHGDKGGEPRDAAMGLWGGGSLSAAELAEVLDATGSARPLLLIATTCYGGGFADIVFAGADPDHGPPAQKRCGFFATTADLPASGCDPDPAGQESWAVHFWHALAGEDAKGRKLSMGELDVDGDGVISPLEAHAHARIAGADIDVPTTTSERWLRTRAPRSGPGAPIALPEEDAVIAALAKKTRLGNDPRRVRAALAAMQQESEDARAEADEERAAEDEAYGALAGALLARWPVLDDPWHPAFEGLLERDGDAIARFLSRAPERQTYRAAADRVEAAEDAYWAIMRRLAPVARLARALETRELARRLAAAGGRDLDLYRDLVACERRRP